MLLSII